MTGELLVPDPEWVRIAKGGNPYHDDDGQFTHGPGGPNSGDDDESDERPTTASAATDPELGEGETPPDRAYPTRTALHEALIQLENEATEVVLAALTPVLTNAAARLVADPGSIAGTVGLTASAVEDLTSIIEEWGGAVDSTVIPHYEKVFQLGGISAVTQLARLGAVTDDFTERTGEYFDEATARYLALAKDRFLKLGDEAWRDARQVMLNGVDRGYGIDVIAQNLRGVVQLSEASARMLARTEIVGAANGGALKQAQLAADAAPLYKAWLCVTGDTRVWSPQPEQVMKRRRPPGPLVRITTATGSVLTVTPQHPILTDRGWVAAHLLRDGDHAVRHGREDAVGHEVPSAASRRHGLLGVNPYVDHVPPRIDEVHRAASDGALERRVTSVVVDLDCGGAECDVEVVPVDGHLGLNGEASFSKPPDDFSFVLSDVGLHDCLRSGTLCHRRVADAPPGARGTAAGYSTFHDRRVLVGGTDETSRALVPELYASFGEPAGDGGTGDVPSSGELSAALAGEVTLDEIVEVVRFRETRCHDVYDLSTGCGWFVADGLIVHNSTDDARVRPTHWEVDMRVTGLHDVWRVGGALLEYPGDPSGPPEETLNCRCSVLLLDDPAELEGGFPGRGEGGVLADVADLEGGES